MRNFRVRPSGLRFVCAAILFLVGTTHLSAQSVDELRAIQAKIERVVATATPATVVVSDGLGSGSGVVVSEDGLVLTAGHVMVAGSTVFHVTFPDGRQVTARPVGRNLNVDAAMLRISTPGPWPHVEMGDSDRLKVGDWCVCLGHSGGYDLGRVPPVRAGKVLALKPTQLVTDCCLIGGDSGGPLFDLDARLIGIHSSISYDSIAINRHVTINTFRKYWDRMLAGQCWGVLPELTNEDDELLRARAGLGITVESATDGAVISKVKAGSVAAAAGLLPGDRVIEFDGSQVNSSDQLIELVKTKDPGDRVQVVVRRNQEVLKVHLQLEQIEP